MPVTNEATFGTLIGLEGADWNMNLFPRALTETEIKDWKNIDPDFKSKPLSTLKGQVELQLKFAFNWNKRYRDEKDEHDFPADTYRNFKFAISPNVGNRLLKKAEDGKENFDVV
jgi:hypothetical protein